MKNKKILFVIILSLVIILFVFVGIFGIKFAKQKYHRDLSNIMRERQGDVSSVYTITYHDFLPNKYKEKNFKDNMYIVTTENFEKQLMYLKENDYYSITIDDLEKWLNFEIELPEKSVLITIDDGYLETYKYALPLLEKYNYNAIVFCVGTYTKEKSDEFVEDSTTFQYLGMDLINDIKDNHPILQIGAHSNELHGVDIKKYSYDNIYNDVLNVKNKFDTKIYSYPNGVFNDNYIKAIKNANYKLAFRYKPSSVTFRTDNHYALSRIEVDGNIGIDEFKNIFR